jgi:C4-dicarboxylate transporter DctM subunit
VTVLARLPGAGITLAGIGANSPPMGIGVFVAAQIGDTSVEKVGSRMRPYLIPLQAGLLLVPLIPVLVTWLPGLVHL